VSVSSPTGRSSASKRSLNQDRVGDRQAFEAPAEFSCTPTYMKAWRGSTSTKENWKVKPRSRRGGVSLRLLVPRLWRRRRRTWMRVEISPQFHRGLSSVHDVPPERLFEREVVRSRQFLGHFPRPSVGDLFTGEFNFACERQLFRKRRPRWQMSSRLSSGPKVVGSIASGGRIHSATACHITACY
jgi:hypothetical protein